MHDFNMKWILYTNTVRENPCQEQFAVKKTFSKQEKKLICIKHKNIINSFATGCCNIDLTLNPYCVAATNKPAKKKNQALQICNIATPSTSTLIFNSLFTYLKVSRSG